MHPALSDDDDPTPALGMVVDEGRGALPYRLVHGESLVACAAWALGRAGVDLVDASLQWAGVVEAGEDVVLHDALCPMTPPGFIADCLAAARATGQPVVGVDDTGAVLSPVVLPAPAVAGWPHVLPHWPSTDLAALVGLLEASYDVQRRVAPPSAARVTSDDDIAALEHLTAPEDAS
jgi:2-C-methyl-D-erythritol 4-phosphate cytidylyltransferase